MKFQIQKSAKRNCKARIALCGPPGAGKTLSSLEIAAGLAQSMDRVVLIDSENASASMYADGLWSHLVLPDTRVETYIEAIKHASRHCDCLVVDSLSHAWNGPGGALESVDDINSSSSNKMEGWRRVTPKMNLLTRAIMTCAVHIIVTFRTKVKWTFEEQRGRKVPVAVGTGPIFRDGVEYEFDLVAYMNDQHTLRVTKSRIPDLDSAIVKLPDSSFGETILKAITDEKPSPPAATAPVKEETNNQVPDSEPEKKRPEMIAIERMADVIGIARDDAWRLYIVPELAKMGVKTQDVTLEHLVHVSAVVQNDREQIGELMEVRSYSLAESRDGDVEAASCLIVDTVHRLGLRLNEEGVNKAFDHLMSD